MSATEELDPIATIERRREEGRAKHEKKRLEQYATDLEALADLEDEHGCDAVASLTTDRFVEGLPTMVVIKAPDGKAYKKFVDQIRLAQGKAKKIGEAQDDLADYVWLYPSDKEKREEMKQKFPGTLASIVIVATKLADLREREEGKG